MMLEELCRSYCPDFKGNGELKKGEGTQSAEEFCLTSLVVQKMS